MILLASPALSQQWVDLGIKGSWGANLLLNSNIFGDSEFNHRLSGGWHVGGKVGYNLSENHEITFDFMYGKFNQSFTFAELDTSTGGYPEGSRAIGYNMMDFILMYRFNNEGRYFEFGPRYSLIGNQTISTVSPLENSPNILNPEEAQNYFSKNAYGLAMGFGNYFFGTENFGITFGARFTYDISDLVASAGQSVNFPSTNQYDTYKGSFPLTAEIICEFNFDFGYLARANCGKRTKLIVF